MDTVERPARRRSWVVLLYFYVAALVGLGFLVVGATIFLFGAKGALVPQLGLSPYSYQYDYPLGPDGTPQAPEETSEEARERAIDNRRNIGFNDMINGVILLGVGAPVLIWHLKRARRLSETAAPVDSP